MPNFSIVKDTNKSSLAKKINEISYAKGAHQAHFDQLKNVILTLNKQSVTYPKRQLILLGAVLFTQARIKAEYSHLTGLTPAGGFINPGSQLSQLLNQIPQVQSLLEADDSEYAQSFILSVFNGWYNDTAFNIEEDAKVRIITNPLCKNGEEYKQFEPILHSITKRLPAVTPEQMSKLQAQSKSKNSSILISSSGYSLEANSVSITASGVQSEAAPQQKHADRSWGEYITSRPVIGPTLGVANTVATAVGLNFWSSAPKTTESQAKVEENTAEVNAVASPTA